jgi:heat shock protein HslJ
MLVVVALVALALAACGACGGGTDTGAKSIDLQGRTFVVKSITEDSARRTPVGEPTIAFELARMTIFTGCNHVTGPYGIQKKKLLYGLGQSTLIGCDEPTAAQEKFLTQFIESSPTIAAKGSTLTLTKGTTILALEEKPGPLIRPTSPSTTAIGG